MKRPCIVFLTLMLVPSIMGASAADEETSAEVIRLNNEGVAAQNKTYRWKNHRIVGASSKLTGSEYKAVIEKFEAALKLDPNYSLARENLAAAHNNFGLYLASHEHKPTAALRELHQAVYIDPNNQTTIADLSGLIKYSLRLNPGSFAVRIKLGDQSKSSDDLAGAVVEYCAALKLKNDPQTHKKLGDAYRLLDEKDKAVAEYAAAYRDN
jgi:tetratricopeptide (TPR) repeat protein